MSLLNASKYKYFKINKVDYILSKNNIITDKIFYSPIITGMVCFFSLLFIVDIFIIKTIEIYLLVFLNTVSTFITFLFLSFNNNSFALDNDNFYVINPYFPFKKIEVFSYKEIESIDIGIKKRKFIFFFNNVVKIYVNKNVRCYFCFGLEPLGYDDISTEKSLDDLYLELKNKNIDVAFNF
jgi:hypothetical protein